MKLKLFLIISLIHLCEGTKRRLEENQPIVLKQEILNEFHFSTEKTNEEDLSSILHSTSSINNQDYTKLGKSEDSYDESKKKFSNLIISNSSNFSNRMTTTLEIKKETSFLPKSETTIETHEHLNLEFIKKEKDWDDIIIKEEINLDTKDYFDVSNDYIITSNVNR